MLKTVFFALIFLHFATTSFCQNSVTTLSPSQAAAVADFPLVVAFINGFTKYSYADYEAALSSQGTTIPYVLNNYFLAFDTVSSYDQIESIMMETFPFSEFAAVVTKVSWYSELLSVAEITTYYFPSDFSTGTVVTMATELDTSTSSGVSISQNTYVISSYSSIFNSLTKSTNSQNSSLIISSEISNTQASKISSKSIAASKSSVSSTHSNIGSKRFQSAALFILTFALLL
ncbi:hypothetical protein QEN19_000622 [Hanseniaspora menglaensis]